MNLITELTFPDHGLRAALMLDDLGQCTLELSHHGAPVLEPSTLGLTIDDCALSEQLTVAQVGEVEPWSVDYEIPHGKRRCCRNAGVAVQVLLAHPCGLSLGIELRLCPDGLALRYALPQGAGVVTVVIAVGPAPRRLEWCRAEG